MTTSSALKPYLRAIFVRGAYATVLAFHPQINLCSTLTRGGGLGVRVLSPSYSFAVHRCDVRQFSSTALRSSNSDNLIQCNPKYRVVFLGTPEVAASSLQRIYTQSKYPTSNYEIIGVVTQPDKRRKRRSGEITSTPVGILAEDIGIPILCPEKARDADFLSELENHVKPDLCITAAYGQYLPKRFLAIPKFGTLNIHPSLLPRWRGSSPVQRSLEAGDNPVGVSVLFTVSKMDAGPIISQESLHISEDEQATTLLPLLFEMGTTLLLDALPEVFSGQITMDTAALQDELQVVEAGMIGASEGRLWPQNMTAVECHNRVRGFSMWPGTYIYVQIGDDANKPSKLKIVQSKVSNEAKEITDEIRIGQKKGDGLHLVCFDSSVLEILQVQPATRNVMDANSFTNGLQGRVVRWLKDVDESSIKIK